MRYFTLEKSHVGKSVIFAFGGWWFASGFIGRIMQRDIGKRVYLVSDKVLQVENDEQRATRLGVKGTA